MSELREVQEPARGSGPVECDGPDCRGHRTRCNFGRMHAWTRPWFENGRVQRLGTTYYCGECGGVCTGEEGDCNHCGDRIAGTPVTEPGDVLRRRWCRDECRVAEFEEERQRKARRAAPVGSEAGGP